MASPEAQPQADLTLETQAQEDLRLGKETVANDSTFDPTEASETTAQISKSETWQKLKEVTQDLLKGAYEKIKSSEPVQNALDRFQVWKNAKMSQWFESKLENANKRQKQANQESDVSAQSAADIQKNLDDLTAQMESMGMKVPEDARQKALAEIASARERDESYAKVAQIRGGRVTELRGKYETYQQNLNGATERINGRLSAKQEGNNTELALQKRKMADLLAEKKQQEEFLQKLDVQYQTFETQVKTLGRGATRRLIESSMKEITKSRERKVRNLRNLGDVLASVQNEIAVLNQKNEALEARKVKSEPAPQPTVDVPVEAVETPVETDAPTPPRRARRRPQVAMG